MDGHHFRVHGERGVCLGSAAAATQFLECDKILGRLLLLSFRLELVLLALLQLGLHIHQSGTLEGAACDTTVLECAAIETRAVVVVALADDLTTAHDDTAVAVVQRRFCSLLEAKRQVIVRLHFAVGGGFGGLLTGAIVGGIGGGSG